MYRGWIRFLQYLSILMMWMFGAAIIAYIQWMVVVAARWNDALNWTVAISLVMTPVYLVVAGTLTYVFVGLRRGAERRDEPEARERGKSPGS